LLVSYQLSATSDSHLVSIITGIVTAIGPSSKRPGRFVVAVNGQPAATVSLEVIERLRLQVGGAVDERAAASLEREGVVLRALDRALDLLTVRGRSVRELRRRLQQKGEEPPVIDAAVERLSQMGLLDDAEFARQFARSKVLGPGLSKRRLQQELFRKGVAREVADDAISDVMADDGVDEDAIIERVARKKLRTLARLDAPTRRRRLYAFLARRGYESDDIRRVMGELLEPADAEADSQSDGEPG
jgi:regulatory protein